MDNLKVKLGPCTLWPRGRTGSGYGAAYVGGKQKLAHRVAYCKAHGIALDDIQGMVVRHKCDNPPCVNPEHLEIGTYKDNTQDCLTRGRGNRPKGDTHCHAKLTYTLVAQIKARYVPGCRVNGLRAIARELGMNHNAIGSAIRGQTWIY